MSTVATWHCTTCQAHAPTVNDDLLASIQALKIHRGRSHHSEPRLVWHRKRRGHYQLFRGDEFMGEVVKYETGWLAYPDVEIADTVFDLGPHTAKAEAQAVVEELAAHTIKVAVLG